MPSMRLPQLVALALLACSPVAAQVTESPQTVAPGKVLFEVDGVRLALDRADAAGNVYDALAVASTIVSAGLTRDVDVQIGADLYLRQSFTIAGRKDHASGVGDVSFRFKWTFWRNDQVGAAAAVIPYVRVPTGSSAVAGQAVEGGFIVPWEMTTPRGLHFGAMFQWDVVRNDADNGYDANWVSALFAEQKLTKAVSLYAETTFTASSTGANRWTGDIGVGALWQVSSRLTLDYELQRGFNHRSPKWTHTWRANWEW